MKKALKIKRVIMAAIYISLILSGCSGNEEEADTSLSEAEIISSAVSTSAETVSAIPETSAESSVSSIQSEDTAYETIFSENKASYVVALCEDGTYKKLTDDEYSKIEMAKYLNELLSEEYYNELINVYGNSEFTTIENYEDYKQMIMESFEISESDLTSRENYKCIFNIYGSFENENADYDKAAEAAFEYVLKKAENNDMQKNIAIDYYVDGDIMNISAYGYSENDINYIADGEYISLSGKKLVIIGDTPIYSDTKSLYISDFDETRARILDNGENEEYEAVIFDHGSGYAEENAVLDTAELAEKLPGLEKLYISAKIDDLSAFSRFENLKELHIDVTGFKDISALSGLKTDRLEIDGITCPADVLGTLGIKEICIECTSSDGVLESIYKLKNVSELTIASFGFSETTFEGIENMSGLKKLDISVEPEYTADISPLAKLDKVEDLRIVAFKTKNLDKISEMKSVKKLLLHSMEDEDLSFLSEMTELEELSLMYVNSSFGPSLQHLKKVKYFSAADITDGADMSRIYQMENLEELHLMGENFNTRGIGDLKSLKALYIMLCSYSDLSGLKKCGSLERLIIYNCVTPEFDAKDIEGMTQLKNLNFSCSEIDNYESLKTLTGLEKMQLYFCYLSSAEQKEIKRALPDCVITLDDGSTVS